MLLILIVLFRTQFVLTIMAFSRKKLVKKSDI